MAVPYTFQTATGSIPLSQLDSNFSTAITIGNTAVILGETITTINNLSLANVTISSVASAFPNNYLANSNVIVGTTTLTLGTTVSTINGLTLSNVTISSGNVTISNVTTTNVSATTANISGTANVGTLVVIGNETVGGNTTVTGNITAAKGTFTSANISGTSNISTLVVTGTSTLTGAVTVQGLTVGKGNSAVATNTALGVSALAANTSGASGVAIGYQALQANTTASNNTAVGNQAGYNHLTTSGGIVALGFQAAFTNSTGNFVTALGFQAAYTSNNTGTTLAVGYQSLKANTTGNDNTAIGSYNALVSNTTGSNNTAVGREALQTNITSSNNTAVGYQAGNLVTGAGNQLFGYSAGSAITTGAKNTIIGSYTGSAAPISATGSNYIVLSDGDGNVRQTIDSSGNVGIGTTTPQGKLNVANGTIYVGSEANTTQTNNLLNGYGYRLGTTLYGNVSIRSSYNLSSNAASLEFYVASDGTTTTERMRIDNLGNVGIGVTPSAWGSTLKAIQLSNRASFYTNSSEQTIVGNNLFVNSSAQNIYLQTTQASAYLQGAGAHSWYNAASGTAGTAITFTQAMTLDASGNLGIGTTTISYRLDVRDSIAVASITSTSTTAGNQPTLRFQHSGNNTYQIKGGTNLQFLSDDGTNERVRIDSVGNAQFQTGAVMPYAPAPAAISAAATLTNANIQGQIISATGTTYTITMPLGTTLETLATWAATNISYDFFVINTASGTVTMAVNTGVTSLGTLTIATGVSAHFRIRRTAANTFVLYRLG
jgi:hypothetical protein